MTAETSKRDTTIVKMYQAGKTCAAIAKKFGVSTTWVSRVIHRHVQNPHTVLKAGYDQRRDALITVVEPLIKAGFTRAEIVRQGVSGADFMLLQKLVPAIFKDHRTHMALRKDGLNLDQLEALAAPYQISWRKFKSMYDMVRYNTIKGHKKWQLSFVEWFTVWSLSGAWQIGNINIWPRHGMVLINEDLPYQLGNVRVIEMSLVIQEWWRKHG